MWADFPRNKHLKQAIYRGPGGAGDATGDATNASVLAVAAKDLAETAATSASASSTTAASSATAASTSATSAATSATNAAGSASTASTAATNAGTYASNASDSADEAAASASDADDSATAAASSASAASTSETNAASSASAASTSASNASTSATNASNSATSAASSASAAAASAVTAATFDPALYLAKADNLSGLADTVTAANNIGLNPYGNGFKNRIINGAMNVAQRGTSFTNPNTWTLDRMYYATGTATTVISQSSNAPSGFTYSLYGTQGATAWTPSGYQYQAVTQSIEGNNFYDMGFGTASAKSVTISFWVYASQTGTYNFALCNANQAEIFNATITRSYVTTYTVNAANTWQYVTITVPGDTSGTWIGATNSSAIVVVFNLGSGSSWTTGTTNAWQTGKYVQSSGTVAQSTVANSTFYITGVQLEKGSTATSFDYRPYGTELALCQRYYYRISHATSGKTFGLGQAVSSTVAGFPTYFPVTMRTAPTSLEQNGTAANYAVLSSGGGDVACSSVPIFNSATNADIAWSNFTVASGLVAGNASGIWTVGAAYLGWSAEL